MEIVFLNQIDKLAHLGWVIDIKKWKDRDSANVAMTALRAWKEDPANYEGIVLVERDKKDKERTKLKGILLHTKRGYYPKYASESDWHISLLAASEKHKGLGTVLMYAMCYYAAVIGGVVTVTSTTNAQGFYRNIGMQQVESCGEHNLYLFDHKGLARFMQSAKVNSILKKRGISFYE